MSLIDKMKRKVIQKFKPWSSNYWDNRYRGGGNSGGGSYGQLAEFKNSVITKFCRENNINDVLELGSGDGHQVSLFPPELRYTGLDISPVAVKMCKEKFIKDTNKQFYVFTGKKGYCEKHGFSAPLTLSLDVIYHLLEDEVFENYMYELFSASSGFVMIYASDKEEDSGVPHVRHRRFTSYVKDTFPKFELMEKIPNEFSPEKGREEESFADFYIYRKKKF